MQGEIAVEVENLTKKIDWDLKRDLSKKMQSLDKETKKAIREIVREKLKGNISEMVKAEKR
jgi:coiled-coil domain-containing protein 12